MAPIKQEEQMKDKLEKRRLQPSTESWSILANRLDIEQKSKDNAKFWWLGMAASIVGILLVTTIYFNNHSVVNNTSDIVDTKENTVPQNVNQKIEVPITNEKLAVEELNPMKTISKETESRSNVQTVVSEKNQSTNKFSSEEAVAQIEKTPSSESLDEVAKIKRSTLTFEEQKIQEVVAQINDLKSDGTTVTDAEIDNLLKKAQKEILTNRIYNETTRTVDANALLQDVEADLQQSFRSRVFEALQSGYESVKTAVAERNN